mgnify:CR=1 FL=1
MIEKPEIINTGYLILKKDGLVYSFYKNTETPFTGICGKYYSQYEVEEYIAEDGAFIEGMGYENMLNYREFYKDGLKHGTCEYYGTFGDPIFRENYKFGLRHGECKYDCDLSLYIYYSQYMHQEGYETRSKHGISYLKKKHSSTPFWTGKCIFEKGEMVYSEEEELRKREEELRKRKKKIYTQAEEFKSNQDELF